MPFKYSFLFNVTAGASIGASQRVGGFSESFCHQSQFDNDDKAIKDLLGYRMATASEQCTAVGMRVSNLDTKSKSYVWKINFKGTWAGDQTADFPSTAVIADVGGFQDQNHRLILRGLPDVGAIGGVANLNVGSLAKRIRPFVNELKNGGWYQLSRDLGAPSFKIISISDAGLCTTLGNHSFNPGDEVRILRTKLALSKGGIKGNLVYRVGTVTTNSLILTGWLHPACVSGRVRLNRSLANTYGDVRSVSVTQKKVGAPFFQYRGRR